MNDSTAGRTPADYGLSGLGLVMQLSGSLFAAMTSMFGFMTLIAATRMGSMGGDSPILWYLLIAGTGVTRSLIHRSAGSEILYGHDPFRGIHRYLIASVVNVMAWLAFLIGKAHAPAELWLPMTILLSAWPVTLFAAIHLPGLRELADRIPVTEDKGFEGAAILMLVFGLVSTIATGVMLYLMAKNPEVTHGKNALLLIVVLALFVRAVLHVMAGTRGVRETQVDRAVESASRYADFGVIASFITGGVLLMLMMMETADATGLVVIVCVVWMLLAWPMIVRRFFGERQFADMMAEGGGSHLRAPDLGLSSLGWLLLAMAVLALAAELPALLLHHGHHMGRGEDWSEMMSMFAPQTGRSPWWSVGVAALELWAGIELIRMGELHRIAATAFGAIATVVLLYVDWPLLHGMTHMGLQDGGALVLVYGMMAIGLVIPIATLVLANRSAVPAATARIVPRGPAPGGGGTAL